MRKSFVTGAVILMVAGLIARLFGFVYRVYLTNLIGAEGMGLFQLIVPVYTAVVLTITAGITIAVSKMVAEQKARNNFVNPGRITLCALLLVAAAGTMVSFLLYINANVFSVRILGDIRTHDALLVLVPCLPAIVAAAALKGYFYGIQQVIPTAFSQIAEQAVKIGVLILLAGGIAEKGAEYACAVATLSAALGEIINVIILYIVFFIRRKKLSKKGPSGKAVRKRKIIIELLKASVPVSANRLVISSLTAVEFILIPAMLVFGGLDEKGSMELFGRLTGMAFPLIMFPSLVTNSLATTLVPAISESVSLKNYRAVNYQISKSIQATFILGIIFSAIFICYPAEIGSLIYRREKIDDLLHMLSYSCVFIYLAQTLTGVLNGLGKQGILLRNTIIGSILRIGSVYFLIPVYGISSYILGFTLSLIVTEGLNLMMIHKITGLVFDLREWLLKPGLIGIVMILTSKFISAFFEIFQLGDVMTILLTLSANIFIAGFLMIIAGVLKPEEIFKLTGLKKH